jgi:hypothetical protein
MIAVPRRGLKAQELDVPPQSLGIGLETTATGQDSKGGLPDRRRREGEEDRQDDECDGENAEKAAQERSHAVSPGQRS